MTLAPMEAKYEVTIRNSGDEVVLSDEDLATIIREHLESEYDGVLASVEVQRVVAVVA